MVEITVGPNLTAFSAFVLSWHGFFSFIAVASAVYLVGRWAPMRGIDTDDIYSIAIFAIISGIVGARIVHVIDHWDFYGAAPGQIIAVWNGGIGLWGGILGGFIGGATYALWRGHPVGVIADLTAPAMLFVQSIGRLGDIVNGEHCAKAWDFALGFMWTHPASDAGRCANGIGVAVQPVIAYEIIWNLLALALIWKLRNRLRPDGMLFALYLALYSIGRFGVSFLREDRIWALGMQEAHFIALGVLAITVPLLLWKARPVAAGDADEEFTNPVDRRTRAERRRNRRR